MEFRKKRRLRIREGQKKSQKKFCGKMSVKREFKIGWIGTVLIIIDPVVRNGVRISDVSGISDKVGN